MNINQVNDQNTAPTFNPDTGKTVIFPPGNSAGYWAGAPTVLYDKKDGIYLYYRLRQPRGHGDNERGFEVRIARSMDGEIFEDVWTLHKNELNSSSIERSSIVKVHDNLYRLYISYVDPEDNRWRIDVVEAESVLKFNIKNRKKVMKPSDFTNVEGVKDPYVVRKDNYYLMYFVYAKSNGLADAKEMHKTGDVHNTGLAVAPTAMAVSEDGLNFRWTHTVLPVGITGWDCYQARLTTIIPFKNGYTVLWDGSRGVEQNYEEKAAVAISYDLMTFAKVNINGPLLETGSKKAVRYVDAIIHEGYIWYYYEYTRDDGAHELRVSKVQIN